MNGSICELQQDRRPEEKKDRIWKRNPPCTDLAWVAIIFSFSSIGWLDVRGRLANIEIVWDYWCAIISFCSLISNLDYPMAWQLTGDSNTVLLMLRTFWAHFHQHLGLVGNFYVQAKPIIKMWWEETISYFWQNLRRSNNYEGEVFDFEIFSGCGSNRPHIAYWFDRALWN